MLYKTEIINKGMSLLCLIFGVILVHEQIIHAYIQVLHQWTKDFPFRVSS
jgi:hypothetical protein